MATFRDGDWVGLRVAFDELQRRVNGMGRKGSMDDLAPQYFTLLPKEQIKSPTAGNLGWNTSTNKVCRFDGNDWVDAS